MCLLVNSFCCCINLDLGTKIISLISTLSSAAILILYGTSVVLLPSLPPSRLTFYACVAVAALLQFVFGCILVYGAFKKRSKYMVPWTVVVWVKCVLLMVLTIAGMVLLLWYSDSPTASQTSSVISVYFIYAVTLFYFVSVVHSRRQELQREEQSDSAKRLMRPLTIPNHYVI